MPTRKYFTDYTVFAAPFFVLRSLVLTALVVLIADQDSSWFSSFEQFLLPSLIHSFLTGLLLQGIKRICIFTPPAYTQELIGYLQRTGTESYTMVDNLSIFLKQIISINI